MNIEELINKLSNYPSNFEVRLSLYESGVRRFNIIDILDIGWADKKIILDVEEIK